MASLALENLLYAASVLAMVALGVVVVIATVPMPPIWRWGGAALVAAMTAAALVGLRLLRGTWDEMRRITSYNVCYTKLLRTTIDAVATRSGTRLRRSRSAGR